jgi:ribonuclease P protein component
MLSKEFRLPASTKLSHTRFFRNSFFGVKYAKNDLSVSRFGFVVKKSVDKRAVVRNRIRRLFRSCIEELKERVDPGYDMLFFLEKGIIDKKQSDLCQELEAIFRQQKLLQ